MHVTVATVDMVLFDAEATRLTVPSSDGELSILRGHMPLVTTLVRGVIEVESNGVVTTCPIESGVLEVRPGGATVIL